jgi:sialate O-acetylesterase
MRSFAPRMKPRFLLHTLTTALSLLATLAAQAEVKLTALFSEHMPQSGKPLAVWGWAAPDEKISVTISGQAMNAKAESDGSWKVTLDALDASALATTALHRPR